ncbi:MAG: VWA domain-containing protein [Gammaproteobacteria bacterium]|jgi:Ca-activated chloride channel family protein|nr:VWA domain-containing protein [Gammaproteobacteria bacterium]
MSTIPAVSFQHPWWLMLIPLCALILLALKRRRRGLLSAYADPALLRWLAPWTAAQRSFGMGWVMAAATLAAVAAAGPVLVDRDEEQPRRAIDLALVFDISPSMTAADPAPGRLQRARMEVHDLIDRLQGERMALIAFSAQAYRVLPLTHDLALLRGYVDALEPGLTRHQGSNLVQALETAAATLELSPAEARAILIVSDGETGDSAAVNAAANRLAERRIPVFALGVGSPNGAPIAGARGYLRDESGGMHISRLDRETLVRLAVHSGGRYADMRADNTDIDYLLAGIAALEVRDAGTERTPGMPLYAWLLAPALLLVLLQGRRYLSPAVLAMPLALSLGILTGTDEAGAAPWDERLAWGALQAGDYERAALLYESVGGYRGKMGAGAAAWRSKNWATARSFFGVAATLAEDERERAAAWFNEANAAARMDDIGDAVALLDRVLDLYPGHTRAARNRALLQRLLDGGEQSGSDGLDSRHTDFAHQTKTAQDAIAEAPDAAGDAGVEDAAGRAAPLAGTGSIRAAGTPEDRSDGLAAAHRFADQRSGMALPPVADDPREVLRHRFMIMDAKRVLLPETQPW